MESDGAKTPNQTRHRASARASWAGVESPFPASGLNLGGGIPETGGLVSQPLRAMIIALTCLITTILLFRPSLCPNAFEPLFRRPSEQLDCNPACPEPAAQPIASRVLPGRAEAKRHIQNSLVAAQRRCPARKPARLES